MAEHPYRLRAAGGG